jgi:hypothetical protein
LGGRALERYEALLFLHCFRFVGLAFLAPGVVSPDLPAQFAGPAAYGNLIAVALALLALMELRTNAGLPLVWIFNQWGTADLLYAFYHGNHVGHEPGQLAKGYALDIPAR